MQCTLSIYFSKIVSLEFQRHNDQLCVYFSFYPAGMDYTTTNTILTFSVSMPTQMVKIPILEDQIVEYRESFRVTLTTNDSAVTLNTATVDIRDNDSKLWAIYLCILLMVACDTNCFTCIL